MSNKDTVLARFRDRIAAACSPVGVTADEVRVTGSGVSIPALGVSVVLVSDAGRRVWRATQTHRVRSLGDEEDQPFRTILFEEPFDREWAVSKRLAMKLAEFRVDAAIDAAGA